ncbi:uncharacterized protein LOC126900850 [Daktulosphaira vitifoliae]|uniref:uncharacterized protein LOC126900850 n=1 Tax=Daktulosphaira vitifoliae TaxID=58002 RepID=UPI0021AAAE08|nr:uncharacterized protein LOC126900850 [Daktulosphaira vitifoliae]
MSRVLSQLKKFNNVCKITARSSSDHHPSYRPLTMDDMPVPKGSWQEHYNKTNSKYNAVLIGGVISLITSIYILQDNVFFNAFPPPLPTEDEQN